MAEKDRVDSKSSNTTNFDAFVCLATKLWNQASTAQKKGLEAQFVKPTRDDRVLFLTPSPPPWKWRLKYIQTCRKLLEVSTSNQVTLHGPP